MGLWNLGRRGAAEREEGLVRPARRFPLKPEVRRNSPRAKEGEQRMEEKDTGIGNTSEAVII